MAREPLYVNFAHHIIVGDNAPTRTEDPDNQTNDIAKGGVCTGRDARTVRFVFVSICCGVARLTNIQISQQYRPGLALALPCSDLTGISTLQPVFVTVQSYNSTHF